MNTTIHTEKEAKIVAVVWGKKLIQSPAELLYVAILVKFILFFISSSSCCTSRPREITVASNLICSVPPNSSDKICLFFCINPDSMPCILWSRVEWFWRKKCYTLYVVPNGCKTPILKFHVFMLDFHLSQSLNIFWHKQIVYHFERLLLKKMCSLACLIANTEEKRTTNFLKLFFR